LPSPKIFVYKPAAFGHNRRVLKVLNAAYDQILNALAQVPVPDWFNDWEEDSLGEPPPSRNTWMRSTKWGCDLTAVAVLGNQYVRVGLLAGGLVEVVVRDTLDAPMLQELATYLVRCELAIQELDAGDVMVQRRDIDDALQAANPAFRKTDAFRRLDDSLK
jgi:hypothetical protein